MELEQAMKVQAKTHYVFECFDKDGKLKWRSEFDNLVTTVGLNKLLDACFKTGLAAPAWYLGLKSTGTPAAADTMGSHASWTDITPYSNATRPALVLGTIAAGSVNNTASKASFNINASADVYGAFLTDDNTVSGTSGILYGAGNFSDGTKSVVNGDTLLVSVTLTISAV